MLFNTCMRKLFTLLMLAAALVALVACASESKKLQPFDPTAAFKDANKELESGYVEEARRKFEEIKRQDTTGQYAPLAQLRIADSYIKSDEPETAADEYQDFLDQYPRHKYAAYAQYKKGMVYYNMMDGPERGYSLAVKALTAFRALQEKYPRNPYREEVDLRIDRCLEVIAGYEYMVGDFYFRREAYKGTIDRLEGALRDYPTYLHLDEVYYRLAVSYKALGQDANAREYLNKLKREFPKSDLIEEAKDDFRDIKKQRAEDKKAREERKARKAR
jgi:outer membrane protein assembly factor BamD